jgi:hypothetical protein
MIDRPTRPEAGPFGAEIEITPEMIEAGVRELALCEPGDSWWSTVESVYRAMESRRRASVARPSQKPRLSHASPLAVSGAGTKIP